MPHIGSEFNAPAFFAEHRDFKPESLSDDLRETLADICRHGRGAAIKMTTIAGSGHPGGSMSSMEMYVLLYALAKLRPAEPWWPERDRIVVSHGHTSPGVYSALGLNGFFDLEPALHGFRQVGSPFEGHVERSVPGVEWDTGNLGQGLSVACGKAVALRARNIDAQMYVPMGDGEQQKGQIAEARRFAVKYALTNVTALIDYNKLQISGDISKVMPQQIAAGWNADGWRVVEVDGHNLDELYAALRDARYGDHKAPTVIIARTVMGKGYAAIENDHNYHGVVLNADQAVEAFTELGFDSSYNNLEELRAKRAAGTPEPLGHPPRIIPQINSGAPRTYGVDEKIDNRSGWGNALVDLADANPAGSMIVYDCDLAGSVKTAGFEKKHPEGFYQAGISEHSTCTSAGATSSEGVVTFWSDFGVFGVSETYNQNRLNDINDTNLKVMCTHCGLDVGEDGKTHQCIDYFGLSRSIFGWKMFTPADPNQTDRIVRYVATTYGNFLVVMGRSKIPTLANENGAPLFGADYKFKAGRTDLVRDGKGVTIFCAGNVAAQGLAAWETLKAEGTTVRLITSAHWADFDAIDLNSIAQFGRIVTVEDHNVNNGIGMSLSAELFNAGLQAKITRLGVADYAPSGPAADVYRAAGIDSDSIAQAVRIMLQSANPEPVSV